MINDKALLHLQNLYKLHLQNVVYVDKYHCKIKYMFTNKKYEKANMNWTISKNVN